jgi:Caspase domain
MSSNHFALIMAASEYEDMRLQQLRSPAADAHALGEVLRHQAIGDYQLDLLLNKPAHHVNETIEVFFKDRNLADQLLLYFSCHGIKDDRGRLYFAASNTNLNKLASTGISSEFVVEQMYECRARRIIVILDCCYSGAFTRGLRHRGDGNVNLDSLAGRGRAVLFASSAMEYAFEIDSSEVDGVGVSSLFTRTIIHALRTGEADLDRDGLVSVDELYDYVLDQLREITPLQKPGKIIDAEGTIFIARSTKAITELGALSHDIRAALSSPLVGIRKGIVEELEPLLASGHAAERQAAREALLQLSNDESDRVAAAATTALGVRAAPERMTFRSAPNSGQPSEEAQAVPAHVRDEQSLVRDTKWQASGKTHAAPAGTSDGQSVDYPPPARGASAIEMAEWIRKATFPMTKTKKMGYDKEEVNIFLDSVHATFLGKRKPPLTAADVRNIHP